MKKTCKLMSILLVIMLAMCTTVNAFTPSDFDGSGGTTAADNDIKSFANNIISIMTTIGMVLAVVVLIVLGIKYMLGSAEEKAEYKKTLMPYFIGAVLIFGASGIATMVFNFTSNVA